MFGGRRLIGELSCFLCDVRILANVLCARPKEFLKSSAYPEDSDEEESTVGKMPPSDSEEEDE
jgi:hypothetical protein